MCTFGNGSIDDHFGIVPIPSARGSDQHDGTAEMKNVVERAFQAPYIGDADERFRRYLARCCAAYRTEKSTFLSPDVTLTQSSGYGKSRLAYNLAQKTAGGVTEEVDGTTFGMRVLYVCARNIPRSSGYPVATTQLREWFFDQPLWMNDMPQRLVSAFRFACEHWDAVGSEWAKLFVAKKADCWVTQSLEEAFDAEKSSPQGKRATSNPQVQQATSSFTPVLVLVVDEARSLLKMNSLSRHAPLLELRTALITANAQVKNEGVIFAVLVDTNSKVHDLALPCRDSVFGPPKSTFPPFVLTHSFDILLGDPASREPFDYEAYVAAASKEEENAQWSTIEDMCEPLVLMGRPLWQSCHNGLGVRSLTEFATCKLICGMNPNDPVTYKNGDVMKGVSSLLCRLGLGVSWRSDAPAAQMVANLMGTLEYVSHTNEARATSFPSEPILAFGATEMWHRLEPPSLQQFMLPQFEEMLFDGAVDTNRIDTVVARVLLLLAMDETGKQTDTQTRLFCPVPKFLRLLCGSAPVFVGDQGVSADPASMKVVFDSWMDSWQDWKMRFCQFVELTQMPTEKTLWFLLGRRAAGVLPISLTGEGLALPVLVVPICCDHDVSFIQVHVTNVIDTDGTFFESVRTSLDVSTSGLMTPSHGPIRLFMSLRTSSMIEPAQGVVIAKRVDSEGQAPPTVTLAVRGMCQPSKKPRAKMLFGTKFRPSWSKKKKPKRTKLWPFLRLEVSEQLEQIASEPWLDPMKEVDFYLARQQHSGCVAPEDQRQQAEEALASYLA